MVYNFSQIDQAKSVAYYNLRKYCVNVNTIKDCFYYDFIVSTQGMSARFAVKVINCDGNEESIVSDFVHEVTQNVAKASQLQLPLILLYVDLRGEPLQFQKLLMWHYDIPTIFDIAREPKYLWNEKRTQILFAEIDKVIRVLPQSMWAIQKTIYLNSDIYFDAKVIYFRRLTSTYKMTSPSNDMTETDRFKRYLLGVPEDEYPSDVIDNLIYQAVQDAFPNATLKSSSLIFNVDVKNLQLLRNMKSQTVTCMFLPNYEAYRKFIVLQSNGVLPQFQLGMYYVPNNNTQNTQIQNFNVECSFDELNGISQIKDTYIPYSYYCNF